MSLHEVTLIDDGPKTSHGLRKTLAASTDPRFVVLDGNQPNPPVPGAQSARMVSLLTFDEVPCGTDIAPIVHRAIRHGPAILAIPSGSPKDIAHILKDIAHILKTGASDVLVAPFRQADTLGRLLHWIGQCAPRRVPGYPRGGGSGPKWLEADSGAVFVAKWGSDPCRRGNDGGGLEGPKDPVTKIVVRLL